MREASIEASAFQRGNYTPGFVPTVTQLIDEHADPSGDQIKDDLIGNPCRCAANRKIMHR